MKSAISKYAVFFILLVALVLAACGTAPATPTLPPVQNTPASSAATITSAPAVPTDTQPAASIPTQEQPSPTPQAGTAPSLTGPVYPAHLPLLTFTHPP